MVTIYHKPTRRALIDPNSERHLLSVTALATILTCEAGRHFLKSPPSVFSFDFDHREKGRPRYVNDGFCKFGILEHPFDVQVFDGDSIKAPYDIRRCLVMKILSCASDLQVRKLNFLARFPAIARAAFLARETALLFLQFLLSLANAAWIFNLFACRKHCKALDTDIYSGTLARSSQRLRFRDFRDKQNIPAISAASYSHLLDFTFQRSGKSHSTRAYARNCELVAFYRAGTDGFEFERKSMIAVKALEARETGSGRAFLDAAKKGLIGGLHSFERIGLNGSQVRFDFRECAGLGQMSRLLDKVQALARDFIAVNPFSKCGVINLSGMFKLTFARELELAVHPQLVLECLDC